MDQGKSEQYEFLDLSDIEENERRHIKQTLYSETAPSFLQLPWINHVSPEEWHPETYGNEVAHVPNGPVEHLGTQAAAMVPQDRAAPAIAQPVPIVTMYSQPPTYSVPPPSSGYQHPPSMLVSSMTPNVNMHGYVTSPYVQPHYNMPEPPDLAVRGHRGRSRGRGNKRADMRMDAPMVETTTAPGYGPQFMPFHYHPTYYTTPVGSPMQHPSTQHATGSPLFITPMYTPMYGAYPGPQYYTPPNAHLMEDAGPADMGELPVEEDYESPGVVNTTVILNSNMVNTDNYAKPGGSPANDGGGEQGAAGPAALPEPAAERAAPAAAAAADNTSASVTEAPPARKETDCKVRPSVDTNSANVSPTVPAEAVPAPAPAAAPAPVPAPLVHTSPDARPVVDSSSQAEAQDAPAPAHPGKTWASLFDKSNGVAGGDKPPQLDAAKPSLKPSSPFARPDDRPHDKCAQNSSAGVDRSVYANDPNSYRIGEFLSEYRPNNRTVSLQPRGLTNRSNYCYINSILQALLACPPFYNLLKALPYQPRKNPSAKSPTPIMDTMFEFVNEFVPVPAGARVNRKEKGQRKDDSIDVICGTSFEPSRIYKILNGIRSDTFIVEGRQEDAEEFFGCLLNGLNDEMLELMKLVENGQNHQSLSNGDITTNGDSHEDKGEWKVMGPKSRSSVTRRADFGRTPISDIFRGQLRSRVLRTGDQITDNVQPFFTLQLDIEKATSVCEALELLVNKDKLEGVTCSRTNQQVEAWQQVTLEELPLVMVLHLKCFNYKLDACSKIIKALEFPIDLKIDTKLLSAKAKQNMVKQKQYKLFAVVYHDGKEASKGHYLTDAYHVGYGGWVRYDDAAVKSVQEAQVLHPGDARVPYLLFYRRADTIGNQQTTTPKRD